MVTSTLKDKRFSSSDIFEIKNVCNSEETLQEEHIIGMVARICDRKEQIRQDRISEFLAPRGSFSSFKYPDRQDILNVPYCDILSTISTTTKTWRTYVVEEAEQKNAINALKKKV